MQRSNCKFLFKTFNLKCSGLRFFTVYGPYGRPDMALFKFTKSIIDNDSLELFNNGKHYRDFTYIDDIIRGIYKIIKLTYSDKSHNIYNIGNGKSKFLKHFLNELEKNLGKKAKIIKKNLQKGDVYKTHSSISKINKKTGFKPEVNIEEGIRKFVEWYSKEYNIRK